MSIKVSFDEAGYKSAKKKVATKKSTMEALIAEAGKFISLKNKGEIASFKKMPTKHFEFAFLQKFEGRNVLQLSFHKLAELLEVDLSEYYRLLKQYQDLSGISDDEPDASKFERLATEPDQIARYNVAQNLCDALLKLKQYKPSLNLMYMASYTQGVVAFDIHSGRISPNPAFVMGELQMFI